MTPYRRRAGLLFLGVFAALVIILLRLFSMGVLHGSSWRKMAENNRLRTVPLEARRGRVYDRNGAILAENRPSFQLLVFPDEMQEPGRTCLFLARAGFGSAADLERLFRSRIGRSMAPRIIADDLSWSQVLKIRSHQSDHPELAILVGARRHYPFGKLAAHAVGYLRRISRSELASHPGLDPNALVGASGVEQLQNGTLAGVSGERKIVVSAIGQQLGVVSEKPPIAGRDLTLTLDMRLQNVAAKALGSRQGAVVALDPRTGAIRVLYSSPAFDPNVFTGHLTSSQWKTLSEDPSHPLQDRAIQGVYPPGSTIKPFYALEALDEGVATPGWTIHCSGSTVLFGHTFHCWRRSGHGVVSMVRSLEVSCDIYYYHLGVNLGIDRMAAWLGRFGFGRATGSRLPGEQPGLVGTPAWVERVRHHRWYPGTTVSVAIGQGPILVTPLQLTRAYAALANGGRLVVPHLVEGSGPDRSTPLGIPPEDLDIIRRGLTAVVHGSEGTARRFKDLPMAGKTGTAQVAHLKEGSRGKDIPWKLRHHALFVGWAPLGHPRIVVGVVVEHGGEGASAAAPVVAAVIRAALGEGPSPVEAAPAAGNTAPRSVGAARSP
ncbi:MAG: penicillin-binding protein 2 [Acidobacteria bacterium]|nr:penicillin-binding protein 2 [Acidobacteriota bacterium]